MRSTVVKIALCLSLAQSFAHAQTTMKDPLNYPIKTYGLMFAVSIFGGIVSWYAKVRKGEVNGLSIHQFIGEICTSAFAGLLTFWFCELANAPLLLTAPLAGIAGHMGTRAIQSYETWAQKRWPLIGNKKAEDDHA